ncbi:unnamed protein product [Brassica rapa]|uniref:BnaA01g25660D protein n=2 Tax=Brassica TaxID=3705 RepID=A0A078HY05_BRANA|nr:unnamed protein product [Brassica rapa]CDY42229.1 BnaA01g25660D [Brassica napus]
MAAMVFIDFQNCFILTLLCFLSLLCYSLFFRKPKNSPGHDLPPSPPLFRNSPPSMDHSSSSGSSMPPSFSSPLPLWPTRSSSPTT